MRIIQYIDTLQLGGAERMAVNISNALAKQGHEVLLVTSRNLGGLAHRVSPHVHLQCLSKKSALDFRAFMRILKIIREFRPHIMHAHSSSVFWAVLAKICMRPSFLLVFHDHDGNSEQMKYRERLPLIWVSPGIDRIIAVNEILKSWCVKHMTVQTTQIRYIPNFPCLEDRIKHGNNAELQCICIANLRPQKDHETLMRAFALLVHRWPENAPVIKLLLVGQTFGDAYLQKVQALIQELKLEDKVEMCGPLQTPEEVLFTSDVGILSSVSEGLPVSLLEYGLAGLPAVVTEVGQCAEVLGHGKYGLLVPPQNPEALAAAMETLLRHPQDAKQMGEAFRHHVEEHYGAHGFLKAYYALLGPEIMQAEKM